MCAIIAPCTRWRCKSIVAKCRIAYVRIWEKTCLAWSFAHDGLRRTMHLVTCGRDVTRVEHHSNGAVIVPAGRPSGAKAHFYCGSEMHS